MTDFKFNSITQYSSEFNEITAGDNMKGKNFCPFFSLITANRFLSGKDIDKHLHEGNIARAIMCHVIYDKGDQMYFAELLSMTDLSPKDIVATTVELIELGVLGYSHMFPEEDKSRYAVIFLKNGKFFVVLANNGIYYLRDCHESVQFDLFTREQLIKHLNEAYQFNHEINLDGYKVEEYSNIEFLHIKAPFKTNFDYDLSFPIIDKLEYSNNNSKYEDEIDDISDELVYENDLAITEQLNMLEENDRSPAEHVISVTSNDYVGFDDDEEGMDSEGEKHEVY